MRIVGGRHKGRTLTAPDGKALRPTADRVRESVFNILAHGIDGFDLDGITVVDVFCGTGALGLEALSRGAGHGVFIDNNGAALALVRKNSGPLGLAREVTMLKLDATRLAPPPRVAKAPAGLAFLDPPYDLGLTMPALLGLKDKGWLTEDAIAVVEVAAKEAFEPLRGFELLDERTYGAARVLFLRLGASNSS
ncbi:MAG: 16S rRNA (guanine(966)-N(2))-methyltransferase RsmD [Alphaproteobacteria bacterium]|nr:16S rRNA (guanine(966)-N(2))-methyltransferase RsmD [Alphaproteobacteria bacterium]MBT7943311.1 16S rRNA (guanine(966)-N(2))-methyltransferase RsmD [Alphaproteobacteria bacterium]